VKIHYLCGSIWRSAASGGSSCPRGSPASGGRCRSRSRRPFRGSPMAGRRCTVSPPCLRIFEMREWHTHKKNRRIVKGQNFSSDQKQNVIEFQRNNKKKHLAGLKLFPMRYECVFVLNWHSLCYSIIFTHFHVKK
jgi:hypothetical protein